VLRLKSENEKLESGRFVKDHEMKELASNLRPTEEQINRLGRKVRDLTSDLIDNKEKTKVCVGRSDCCRVLLCVGSRKK
jgi:hypothetical protein